MPAMVKAMADTKGLRPDVHMHAAPAASLQSHWNDRRARSNMEGTAWDFVILQDQSATPIRAPERTMEFGEKWCSLIRAAKGTPILMLTWGKRGASGTPDPQEQKALLETYLKLARREKQRSPPWALPGRIASNAILTSSCTRLTAGTRRRKGAT